MNNKEQNKMKILYSPSTRRAIYYYGDYAITSIVDDNYRVEQNLHSAPIDLETMSESFSNQSIKDWEERWI